MNFIDMLQDRVLFGVSENVNFQNWTKIAEQDLIYSVKSKLQIAMPSTNCTLVAAKLYSKSDLLAIYVPR